MHLSPTELRVLGALIEKEITTPENYPLSLNSLQAACNQKSSRDPVLEFAEEDIRQALHSLQDLGLITPTRDSRVPKYEHRARTVLNLRRDETALLCLLLLRGAQTPGELRSRADRLFTFDDLSSVTATLDRLASRPDLPDPDTPATSEGTGPLTAMLARQPGSREARYAHLLGGPVRESAPLTPGGTLTSPGQHSPASSTLSAIQDEVNSLQSAVAALEQRIALLEANNSGSRALDPLDPLE